MKRRNALFALVAGLTLIAPAAGAHEVHVRPIVKLFDPAGPIPPDMQFYIGGLNDSGQVAFFAGNPTNAKSEILLQWSEGKLVKVAQAGAAVPGGSLPRGLRFDAPVAMNAAGQVLFSSSVRAGDATTMGTFLWSPSEKSLSTVALTGMTDAAGKSFTAGGAPASAINNRGEIALVVRVANAANQSRAGLFFRATDGSLTAVALPDGELPGGGKLDLASLASINDAGVVAFLGRRQGETVEGAYLWSGGQLSALAEALADVPGGRKLARATGVWVNSQNSSVLVAGRLDDPAQGPQALYRVADGQLTSLLLVGQELASTRLKAIEAVSAASAVGEHAVLVLLEDGRRGIYVVDAGGAVRSIVHTGHGSDAGMITHLGADALSSGLALNSRREVALGARLNAGIPTLVVVSVSGE
jgi:hypothetical protein